MKRRILGSSQLSVSELCLGTMNFGWKEPEGVSIRSLEQFVDAGGNFIDTANVYSKRIQEGMDFYGKDFDKYIERTSERLIGEWMKQRGNRHELVVATKVGFAYPGIEMGTTAKQIKSECEKSLLALKTDYIDLLYLHMDDRNTPMEESLLALSELVNEGKVRYIGASNFYAWRIAQALEVSKNNGLEKFCCIQQKYSYLRPKQRTDLGRQAVANDEIMDLIKNENLTLLAYSPLLKGYYADESKILPDSYISAETSERMKMLKTVMRESGATAVQIIYKWLLQSFPSIVPVVATSTPEQFNEVLGALEIELTDTQMEMLNNAG